MNAGGQRVGKVRIIGGSWRRRPITFDNALGVRPTPDRVRETLFNWLAPVLPDARCLDLFAGSGALGFEAASRGAREVRLIDIRPEVVRRLTEQRDRLLGEGPGVGMDIECADGLGWISRARGGHAPYDVVFIDPPYDSDLLEASAEALEENGWLSPGALVYLESGPRRESPTLPPGWIFEREKRAGRVRYYLASCA